MQRLIPPVLFFICLGLMAVLRWLWPVRILFPFPYNLLGMAVVAVGLLIGFSGALQFRRSQANIRPFRRPEVFVTDGPYRYTRNPMYLGVVLMLLGAWVLMGALTPLIGVLIFFVAADRWYIPAEEQMLRDKFGPEFDAFCARTRRWL